MESTSRPHSRAKQTTQATSQAPTPSQAAQIATDAHTQQPNLLQQLLGQNGTFSSPVAKLALLGVTAFAAQHLVGRR